ncbi:MAG: hypothetical protein KGL10_07390 [Alphaproteobacteria bacterium]|nr:hypothetical protein [Alphaproteobacteria bacterium]
MLIIIFFRLMGILLMLAGAAFWIDFHGMNAMLNLPHGPIPKIVGGGIGFLGFADFFLLPRFLMRRAR